MTEAGRLEVTSAPWGDFTLVHCAGEVDLLTGASLRVHLDELLLLGQVRLVLDLSAVTFIDSSGLGTLVGAHKKARVFRGSLALVGVPPTVRRVLGLTALDRVLPMFDTVEDATA